ncbi:hypothetical protein BC938DRAFT_474632, partial [Jimgerdemannia flammicorona]
MAAPASTRPTTTFSTPSTPKPATNATTTTTGPALTGTTASPRRSSTTTKSLHPSPSTFVFAPSWLTSVKSKVAPASSVFSSAPTTPVRSSFASSGTGGSLDPSPSATITTTRKAPTPVQTGTTTTTPPSLSPQPSTSSPYPATTNRGRPRTRDLAKIKLLPRLRVETSRRGSGDDQPSQPGSDGDLSDDLGPLDSVPVSDLPTTSLISSSPSSFDRNFPTLVNNVPEDLANKKRNTIWDDINARKEKVLSPILPPDGAACDDDPFAGMDSVVDYELEIERLKQLVPKVESGKKRAASKTRAANATSVANTAAAKELKRLSTGSATGVPALSVAASAADKTASSTVAGVGTGPTTTMAQRVSTSVAAAAAAAAAAASASASSARQAKLICPHGVTAKHAGVIKRLSGAAGSMATGKVGMGAQSGTAKRLAVFRRTSVASSMVAEAAKVVVEAEEAPVRKSLDGEEIEDGRAPSRTESVGSGTEEAGEGSVQAQEVPLPASRTESVESESDKEENASSEEDEGAVTPMESQEGPLAVGFAEHDECIQTAIPEREMIQHVRMSPPPVAYAELPTIPESETASVTDDDDDEEITEILSPVPRHLLPSSIRGDFGLPLVANALPLSTQAPANQSATSDSGNDEGSWPITEEEKARFLAFVRSWTGGSQRWENNCAFGGDIPGVVPPPTTPTTTTVSDRPSSPPHVIETTNPAIMIATVPPRFDQTFPLHPVIAPLALTPPIPQSQQQSPPPPLPPPQQQQQQPTYSYFGTPAAPQHPLGLAGYCPTTPVTAAPAYSPNGAFPAYPDHEYALFSGRRHSVIGGVGVSGRIGVIGEGVTTPLGFTSATQYGGPAFALWGAAANKVSPAPPAPLRRQSAFGGIGM